MYYKKPVIGFYLLIVVNLIMYNCSSPDKKIESYHDQDAGLFSKPKDSLPVKGKYLFKSD